MTSTSHCRRLRLKTIQQGQDPRGGWWSQMPLSLYCLVMLFLWITWEDFKALCWHIFSHALVCPFYLFSYHAACQTHMLYLMFPTRLEVRVVCVCVCTCMHTHMCGGQKWVGVSLNYALLYSFETGSLTDRGWSLVTLLGWLAGQWAQGIFLTLFPQNLDYKDTLLCLHFMWRLGIWTQVLRFVWEVLHWLSHLPWHMKAILRKRRPEFRRRGALANTICPGEIRFPSQSQAPTPTNISILSTPNSLLKGRAIRVLEDLGEFDLASQDSVWLGLERIISSAMDLDLSCACLWHPALGWRQFPSRSQERAEMPGPSHLFPASSALCGADPIINQAGRQEK